MENMFKHILLLLLLEACRNSWLEWYLVSENLTSYVTDAWTKLNVAPAKVMQV